MKAFLTILLLTLGLNSFAQEYFTVDKFCQICGYQEVYDCIVLNGTEWKMKDKNIRLTFNTKGDTINWDGEKFRFTQVQIGSALEANATITTGLLIITEDNSFKSLHYQVPVKGGRQCLIDGEGNIYYLHNQYDN